MSVSGFEENICNNNIFFQKAKTIRAEINTPCVLYIKVLKDDSQLHYLPPCY